MTRTIAILGAFALASIAGAAEATVYTSDPNLSDFTAGVTNYATLSNFSAGDVSSPYTPTSASLAANGYRVYAGGSVTGLPTTNDWILATFSAPVATIRVFPSIDHFGAAFDGFQYSIEGSNDGVTWTPLYDTLTVAGGGEPFTIGSFSGTAPARVNNVLSGGHNAGYIADFSFAGAYKEYAFGASTVAFAQGNSDQELEAVAGTAVPEPATWAMLLIGFCGLGATLRMARRGRGLAFAGH